MQHLLAQLRLLLQQPRRHLAASQRGQRLRLLDAVTSMQARARHKQQAQDIVWLLVVFGLLPLQPRLRTKERERLASQVWRQAGAVGGSYVAGEAARDGASGAQWRVRGAAAA